MNIVSDSMLGLTVSATMEGHTHVVWVTMAMWENMVM